MQLPSNWNQTILARGGHVLQSAEWAEFQVSIGRELYYEINDDWFWLAFNRKASGLHYWLAPHNPVIIGNATGAVTSIKSAAKANGCDFVRLEPVGEASIDQLDGAGARKIADVQPSHTLVLDLTKSEEELRKGLESGHRNRINTGAKRGVKVSSTTDINVLPDFIRLLNDTAAHAKITNHPDWYYEKMAKSLIDSKVAKFYIATAESQTASVSLIFDWGDTRYYAHTGNDQVLNRKYNAAVSNVWQMILDAKAEGKKYFDFWGVAPPDQPNHPWAGITGFKKGFGGEIVSLVGTWDVPIKKHKYRVYSGYRKLRGRE